MSDRRSIQDENCKRIFECNLINGVTIQRCNVRPGMQVKFRNGKKATVNYVCNQDEICIALTCEDGTKVDSYWGYDGFLRENGEHPLDIVSVW